MQQSLEPLLRDASSSDDAARQTRAAARLMSILERAPQRLPELFRHTPLDAWPQPRLVLGVTGAPGSGKSSLTDQLVFGYRSRFPERRVGVVAVDPSSPFTGGSVLGDRVRMMRHATDPQVFIRSLATRGHLGGLSLGVRGVLRVMGLIGCDVVVLETVGVGQSEVEVTSVADVVAVVLAPGQGDSVQLLKAGLMEVGDVFVVNKADREDAAALHGQLLAALSLSDRSDAGAHDAAGDGDDLASAVHARRRRGQPDVFLVSATEGTGVEALIDGLEARCAREHDRWRARRAAAVRADVRESVIEAVHRHVRAALDPAGNDAVQRVLSGAVTVEALARELLQDVGRTLGEPTDAASDP